MKSFSKRFGAIVPIALLAAIFMLLLSVQPADAAAYWQQKFTRFQAIAGETLTTGRPVRISEGDGRVYYITSAASQRVVGLVGKGGAAGETVEIVISGILSGTKRQPGSVLYAQAHAGTGDDLGLMTRTSAYWNESKATLPVGMVVRSHPDRYGTVSTIYLINVNTVHNAHPGRSN